MPAVSFFQASARMSLVSREKVAAVTQSYCLGSFSSITVLARRNCGEWCLQFRRSSPSEAVRRTSGRRRWHFRGENVLCKSDLLF
jgi:hypothetical protein